MLWVIGGALLLLWLVLKFILSHSGYVHLLLLAGLCILVVQFAAERRTRFGRSPQGK